MNDSSTTTALNRRQVMAFAGAVAFMGFGGRAAFAGASETKEAIDKIAGGKSLTEGRIQLELPEIAENGNTVPLKLEVQSPMTDSDYVKAVHVFAEGNPTPEVATFKFTPANGKAYVSTRMRLAKTQDVVAVAEMSDGSLFTARKTVKVTIGGCGG